MIKALTRNDSALRPRRSIAVIPAAVAQVAIFFGLPLSFNGIFVSSIIGSGFSAGRGSVSRSTRGYTVLAWNGSLVVCYVGYNLLAKLL